MLRALVRAVVDTNVLVRGILRRREAAAAGVFDARVRGDFRPLISDYILGAVRKTLCEPDVRALQGPRPSRWPRAARTPMPGPTRRRRLRESEGSAAAAKPRKSTATAESWCARNRREHGPARMGQAPTARRPRTCIRAHPAATTGWLRRCRGHRRFRAECGPDPNR